MASFRMAKAQGTRAIELDAKLSADGQVVVFHDDQLERTTNGTGSVSSHTVRELRDLDAGGYFSKEFSGEKIPLLEEVFEAFGKKLLINVELKNYDRPWDALAKRVCELVRKHSLHEGVMFSSFLPSNLWQARRLLPAVPRSLLARPGWRGAWARSFGFSFGDFAALQAHFTDVGRAQVLRVHRLKRQLLVWTVNGLAEMKLLAEWGVDGILTDDPSAAVSALGSGT